MTKKEELIKLLCLSDDELIHVFVDNTLFYENCKEYMNHSLFYKWRKRFSIYSPCSNVIHEYKWLVDALKDHRAEEMEMLRIDLHSILLNENNERDEKDDEYEIKKSQSCPQITGMKYIKYKSVPDIIEKTINSC